MSDTSATFEARRPPTGVGDGVELIAWCRQMREHHPVWLDDETQGVHVFGFDDIQTVLSTPEVFGSDFGELTPDFGADVPNFMEGVLTMTDPPMHGKLRKLISQGFTPRSIARLEPRVAELADELFDSVVGQDRFDFVSSITYPLPVIVIAELLGIPASDRDLFREWGEALLASNYELPVGAIPEGDIPTNVVDQMKEMRDYLLSHVEDRRRNDRGDLISRLVAVEIAGERLRDTEVVGFLNFLLLAGHLTTTLLMGNALLAFGDAPEALARVRADRSLIPAAVEETLRHRPPVIFQYRLTKRDTEVGGVLVPAGRPLVTWLLAGNRDPEKFVDPDRFDLDRVNNGHLTFGHGIHFCLGTPLARMESRLVMERLLERYSDWSFEPPVYYERSPDIFGVKSLTLNVTST